jgi:hypothetical protein
MGDVRDHLVPEPTEDRRMQALHERQRALVRLSLLLSKRGDPPTSHRWA